MTHRRTPLAIVLVAGTLALVGCERPDPVAAELRDAANTLDALRTRGVGIATITTDVASKRDEQTLATVLNGTAKHLTTTSPGQATSAMILQSRAASGLAELGAERVNAMESSVLDAVHAARNGLDIWLTQTTRAKALEGYSPDAELKELDAQIGKADEAIGKAASDKSATLAKIADLEKRGSELLAKAKAERSKAAEVTARAATMSATQGLPMIEDAAKIGRAADALERQASDLAADADALRPVAAQAEQAMKDRKAGWDQLKVSRTRVQEKADGARANAVAARKAADDAAKAVNEAIALMNKTRAEADGFTLAGKTPIEHYQNAIKNANGALKNVGATVAPAINASIGAYNQKLGDLYVQRGRGLLLQSQTVQTLASAKPALPLGGDMTAAIKEMSEASEKAMNDAKEAYEAAKGAFEKAGARGEAKDAAEKVAAALERIIKRGEPAAATEVETKPAEGKKDAPAGEAGANDAEIGAVRAAMGKIIAMMKEGRTAELGAAVVSEQRGMVDSAIVPILKIAALDDACREKFKKSVFDVVKASPLGMMLGMMAGPIDQMKQMPQQMGEMKAEDLQIKMVSATRAQITGAGQEMTEMVKEGGAWLVKLPMPAGMADMGGMAAMPGAGDMMKKLGDGVDAVTADLKAGKFETTEALSKALNEKLLPLLQGAMMPPPGGG